VNDFDKMQRLYEEGVGGAPYPIGGQLRGFNTDNIGPNMKYSKGLKYGATSTSYGKDEIPTVSPGSTGKRFTVNVDNWSGDEEVKVEDKDISNTDVLSKIEEHIKKAGPEQDDIPYCLHVLTQLRDYITTL
jgi:hypothetical protein